MMSFEWKILSNRKETPEKKNNREKKEQAKVLAETIAKLRKAYGPEQPAGQELEKQTLLFRRQLAQKVLSAEEGKEVEVQQQALKELLPTAFAVVVEAAARQVEMEHFPLQLLGGKFLYEGKVVEMLTGEGKTLMTSTAIYLDALTLNPAWIKKAQEKYGDNVENWVFEPLANDGDEEDDLGEAVNMGVHLVTANDYLAARDGLFIGKILNSLGMKIGILQKGIDADAEKGPHQAPAFVVENSHLGEEAKKTTRKHANFVDVTYGTHNEFGFDHLNDNQAVDKRKRVQRGHYSAILDELDQILADEALTPLILSGKSEKIADPEKYRQVSAAVKQLATLQEGYNGQYFAVKEAEGQVELTSQGEDFLEEQLGETLLMHEHPELVIPSNIDLQGLVEQALRAEFLFIRNRDYSVVENPLTKQKQVLITNQNTGRFMIGQSWSDGLQQAVEAKEEVAISSFNQTFDSITIQSYFRLYDKLAGTTGTTAGLEEELKKIFNLPIEKLPSNYEKQRQDLEDVLFWWPDEKETAFIKQLSEITQLGRPILLSTFSVAESHYLAELLGEAKFENIQVLNAHYHEHEAEIIAQAGKKGAITIITNMGGRGVDPTLGGEPDREAEGWDEKNYQKLVAEIKKIGGMALLGFTRNRLKRVDDQLIGRVGRRDDPGSTQFFVSMKDRFLKEYADSPAGREFREFLRDAEKKGKTGPLTGDDYKKAKAFIKAAQEKFARDESAAREDMADIDEIVERQRADFLIEREKIFEYSPEEIDQLWRKSVLTEIDQQFGRIIGSSPSQNYAAVFSWLEKVLPTFSVELSPQTEYATIPSSGLLALVMTALEETLEGDAVGIDELNSEQTVELIERLFDLKENYIIDYASAPMSEIKQQAMKIWRQLEFGNKIDVQDSLKVDTLIQIINDLLPRKLEIATAELVVAKRPKVLLFQRIVESVQEYLAQEFGSVDVRGEKTKGVCNLLGVDDLSELKGREPLTPETIFAVAQLIFSEKENLPYKLSLPQFYLAEVRKQFIFNQKTAAPPAEIEVTDPEENLLTRLEDIIHKQLEQTVQFFEKHWPEDLYDETGAPIDSLSDFQRRQLIRMNDSVWSRQLVAIQGLKMQANLMAMSGKDPKIFFTNAVAGSLKELKVDARTRFLLKNLDPWNEDDEQLEDDISGGLDIESLIETLEELLKITADDEMVEKMKQARMAQAINNKKLDLESFFADLSSIEQEDDFYYEELLKKIDQQIVVYTNMFVDQTSHADRLGFGVAYVKSAVDISKSEKLSAEELTVFKKKIFAIIKLRAHQLRLKSVLNLHLSEYQTLTRIDPYSRLVESRITLKAKISSLEKIIKKESRELLDF